MPAVWDPQFSVKFYARWGRESAVISARTSRIEYREYRQVLSIKAAFGGSETYYIDGRRKVVDDDTFLILNADRCYASAIASIRPVLLGRMVRLHHQVRRRETLIPARKPSTRQELVRRLALGADFIHAHYRDQLDLKAVAEAAHLSQFYFLHLFKKVYGVTPATFISRKRCAAAVSLLRETSWTMTEVAAHVGFGSRSTLLRKLKGEYGLRPHELRDPAGAA
jgi:AraC-like DNA-binding protein